MFDVEFFSEFLIVMLTMMNPLIIMPAFLTFTRGAYQRLRKKFAAMIALSLLIIMPIIALYGKLVLNVMGVDIYSFGASGGIIIFIMSLTMLHAKESDIQHTNSNEERAKKEGGGNPILVPLITPIIIGPASITAIILFSYKAADNMAQKYTMFVVFGVVICLLWVVLYFADAVGKMLGKTTISAITRIMALILASIGFEMFITSVKQLLSNSSFTF
jgi:multiple antibiotic resistance protein